MVDLRVFIYGPAFYGVQGRPFSEDTRVWMKTDNGRWSEITKLELCPTWHELHEMTEVQPAGNGLPLFEEVRAIIRESEQANGLKRDLGHGWCPSCLEPLTDSEADGILCKRCTDEIEAKQAQDKEVSRQRLLGLLDNKTVWEQMKRFAHGVQGLAFTEGRAALDRLTERRRDNLTAELEDLLRKLREAGYK